LVLIKPPVPWDKIKGVITNLFRQQGGLKATSRHDLADFKVFSHGLTAVVLCVFLIGYFQIWRGYIANTFIITIECG
jgi:hypothetical protein